MVTINLQDPWTFLLLVILGGLFSLGLVWLGIEIVARGMLLHDARKLRQEQERKLEEIRRRQGP